MQQTAQSSQYRVARIVEDNSDEMVFDLRACYNGGGSVCTVHYFIGDKDNVSTSFAGDVRAIIDDVTDGDDLHAVVLDSGADASVLLAKMINAGLPAEGESNRLCDAQGRPIPLEGSSPDAWRPDRVQALDVQWCFGKKWPPAQGSRSPSYALGTCLNKALASMAGSSHWCTVGATSTSLCTCRTAA